MPRTSFAPTSRKPATRMSSARCLATSLPPGSNATRTRSAKRWATSRSRRAARSSNRSTRALGHGDGGKRYRGDDPGGFSGCAGRDPRPGRRRRSLSCARDCAGIRRHEPRSPASGGLCRTQGQDGNGAARPAASDRRSIRRPPMTDSNGRIESIVKANDVVLFMKGSALFPQCGFSSRAVSILDHLGVKYETVDVLADQDIRQGIKSYSDWPTIPQLYVKGEFVGGSDIMMEMFESGELQQLVADVEQAA